MSNFLKIRLTNRKSIQTTFVLEPWGEFWPMSAGETYEVQFEVEGEQPHHLPEIEWAEDSVTVYAGVAGDVRVFRNGRDVREQEQLVVALPLQKAA